MNRIKTKQGYFIAVVPQRETRSKPPKPPAIFCKHCRKGIGQTRARGLCNQCYTDPAILDLYPVNYQRTAHGTGLRAAKTLAPEPTSAAPGSPEKVAVLEWRAANNFALWHPLDREEKRRRR